MALPLVPLLITGLKALLVKLIAGVLAYFLYKILMMFGANIVDWALKQFTQGVDLNDATVQFTGFAAWLADTLMLGQVITLLVSFCVVRFIIGLVRG